MAEKYIKDLCNLVQVDIDAAYAYDQALKNIDDKTIYNSIESFRKDHLRHIRDLSERIKKASGKPPEIKQDFKGFIIEGFTAVRSMTGTQGALAAMEKNEMVTNKSYEKATNLKDMDPDLMNLIRNNYEDEKRHIEYIRQQLKGKK